MNAKPAVLLARLRGNSTPRPTRRRVRAQVLVAAAICLAASGVALTSFFAGTSSANQHDSFTANNDGLGIQPGKIKHVWLIILENKSYDASFTGLNTTPTSGRRCPNRACC